MPRATAIRRALDAKVDAVLTHQPTTRDEQVLVVVLAELVTAAYVLWLVGRGLSRRR